MTTDLTFFTNEPDAALLDRFKATLRDVQFFDVLVGYFRTSGFEPLCDMRGRRPRASHRERELNALVYELYGLTEDEVAIVEGRA